MFWLKVLWVSLGGGGSFPLQMKCWFKFYTTLPGVRISFGLILASFWNKLWTVHTVVNARCQLTQKKQSLYRAISVNTDFLRPDQRYMQF